MPEMTKCLLCGNSMEVLVEAIRDWEYGVPWNSRLVMCVNCGLVVQQPPICPEQIAELYPDNYLAHSPASTSTSLYGRLKSLLALRSAKNIVRHVPSGGTLLEIGCGNGHLLRTISGLRPDIRLVGVDIKKVEMSDLPNFVFHHGQFENSDIPENSIDVVYCSNLIEHVPDPVLFAEKIHSSLRAGGVLIGVTPDHLSIDRYLFGRFWAGYHYPRHTFLFNHQNIRYLLTQAGFQNIEVHGSYSFWYLSLANRFVELPGTKKRGVAFALVTALFLPLDLLINLFMCHGSMTFTAVSRC